MAESFGRLLQRYRVAAGLSQEQLAELAGVSTNAISSLERGLRLAPHSATVDLLAAALKLDDGARKEFEEAANLARVRRNQAQQHEHNLPPELTSFVDREKELPEIKELLQSHRLVTVVGAGGAGKTRCAIKIGGEVLGSFVDGVWVADLTPISDPSLVAAIIARALKVQESPHRPLLETLLAYLKRKRLLLILDNCEHLIDEARRVATAILHDCADVRILATSRERLSIAGEHAYRMPSLPVPSASKSLSAIEMSQYGAVRLFTDRAFSANSRFTLTAESAPHVAEICTRLDGIPLAIELAAARVTALSPKQLSQKLDERFRVLGSGDRSALPRHQTMRALIDWSYDLLSDGERALFRELSIFAGGFTLETASAVCRGSKADEILILELLSSLVEKSLVQAEVLEEATRYRLLESTRQYAREKLRDIAEEEPLAQAHARTFLELAKSLTDVLEEASDSAWRQRVEPELENFRAALSWAFGSRGDVLLGQQLVTGMRPLWGIIGPVEGRRWVQTALQRVGPETPDEIVAGLDLSEAYFWSTFAQIKLCLTHAERALARYEKLCDRRGIVPSKAAVGGALVFLGKSAQGETLLWQALESARLQGMRRLVIWALDCLGLARSFAGDLDGARQRYSEALEKSKALGLERATGNIALNLAEVEFRDGNAAGALRLVDEAAAIVPRDTLARARYNGAAYLVSLHRFDEARLAAREAVAIASEVQFSVALVWALQHLAAIAALRLSADRPVIEDRRRAAGILGYVNARVSTLDALRQYTERQEYDATISALRGALGEDETIRRMGVGATWSEYQAIAEAMLV